MNIVITGAAHGIGFAIARQLVRNGHRLTICSRSEIRAQEAAALLNAEARRNGPDVPAIGVVCDVSEPRDIERLWDASVAHGGDVDIWINNAALSTRHGRLDTLDPAEIERVVRANLLGVLFGTRLAFQKMSKRGSGHIYNVEGLGSGGEIQPGTTTYGATKCATSYVSRAMARAAAGTGVGVSLIQPGMAMTALFKSSVNADDDRLARFIMNTLGDRPEDIASFLAPRILANARNGATIKWMGLPKIVARFLLAPFRKRDIYDSGLQAASSADERSDDG